MCPCCPPWRVHNMRRHEQHGKALSRCLWWVVAIGSGGAGGGGGDGDQLMAMAARGWLNQHPIPPDRWTPDAASKRGIAAGVGGTDSPRCSWLVMTIGCEATVVAPSTAW
mmetsp:Transcript_96332/g.274517  ORF Transcript_96332/g.274517 Transcript_96332/m.274517 type:complete len:110 (+) Transcript_96332:208-537(+)